MKTATTLDEKRSLRDIILTHFLSANDMASILDHPEVKGRFSSKHVKHVVYALGRTGLVFESGNTKGRLYQTTADGKRLIEGK